MRKERGLRCFFLQMSGGCQSVKSLHDYSRKVSVSQILLGFSGGVCTACTAGG